MNPSRWVSHMRIRHNQFNLCTRPSVKFINHDIDFKGLVERKKKKKSVFKRCLSVGGLKISDGCRNEGPGRVCCSATRGLGSFPSGRGEARIKYVCAQCVHVQVETRGTLKIVLRF